MQRSKSALWAFTWKLKTIQINWKQKLVCHVPCNPACSSQVWEAHGHGGISPLIPEFFTSTPPRNKLLKFSLVSKLHTLQVTKQLAPYPFYLHFSDCRILDLVLKQSGYSLFHLYQIIHAAMQTQLCDSISICVTFPLHWHKWEAN